MDIKSLKELYKEWADWYNAECSFAEIEIPYINTGNKIENIMIKSPIEHYCGYDGSKINKYLREGKYEDNGADRSFELALYATMLITLIKTTPIIPEEYIAYRYISKEEMEVITSSNLFPLKRECVYHKKDFLSVTLNKELHKHTDEEYTKTKYMLELTIPKGIHAIFPMLLHLCGRETEAELILQRGAYIHYNGKKRKENGKIIYSCRISYPYGKEE